MERRLTGLFPAVSPRPEPANRRSPVRLWFLVPVLSAFLATASEPPDYSEIEAVFAERCLDCHSSVDPEANLVMETHGRLMQGGSGGPAVVAGQSEDSLLVKLIEGRLEKDGKTRIMPPGRNEKLKPEEIARIRAWIDGGAKPSSNSAPRELVVPKIEPRVPPRNSIHALAAAPDGKLVAVGRYGSVELRSADTRAGVRELTGHRGHVNALAFSRDGKFLFAAGGEPGILGEVRQWNVMDGALIRVFDGPRDALHALALSPDGSVLVAAGYDQKITFWDPEAGSLVRTLAGHNGAVFGLAIRPDGRILASASADRTIKLWDVASGERRDTLSQPLKEQYAVAFSPDGARLVAAGADSRIRVWQISENAGETTNPILESKFAHEGAILTLAFSADGRRLASSAEDRTIKIWNGTTLAQEQVLETQPDWSPGVAFVLENRGLVAGRLDGSVQYYETSTGKVLAPDKPVVTGVEPRGIQIGRETRVRLTGTNLSGVTGVRSPEAALQAGLVDSGSDGATSVWIRVLAGNDLAPGGYSLMLASGEMQSEPFKIELDDLPQITIDETQPVHHADTLPAGFWGVHEVPGDTDTLEFETRAGQTLVFDLAASRIGSKADAVLTLQDAAGATLASSSGFDRGIDPLIAHTFERAGRYRIQISEQSLAGSGGHFYRLSIGDFPFVTGVYPLSAAAHSEVEIELVGYNLPEPRRVKLQTGGPGDMGLREDCPKFRSRREFKILIGPLAEFIEAEPNNDAGRANAITPPCSVGGRIGPGSEPADEDLFRFRSGAGREWIIETQAAQLGSPVDTRIEVLHGDGRPVERLQLRAVRNTAINFRSIDSDGAGARLDHYEEMELNDFVYFKGEVVRLFRMPQGPDSDMLFYTSNGRRRAWFDTSPMAHALDEPAYVVEPGPPGERLPPNGLPVFRLNYTNDDDGERRLGTDSRVHFTAPAEGEYLVRVTDNRRFAGDRFVYRLLVRDPRPDFEVRLTPADLPVNAGSGREFTVVATREDGFDGEIRLDVGDLPPGFTASTPLIIQAGHVEARGIVHAAADASKPDDSFEMRLVASATIEGRPAARRVKGGAKIRLEGKPALFVSLRPEGPGSGDDGGASHTTPLEITLAPGQSVPARLAIVRNGYDDLVTFTVENLPHGVIVDNIGLNGVLIPKDENEREIFISAARWVPETERLCYAVESQAGRQTSLPVLLRIRKPDTRTNR